MERLSKDLQKAFPDMKGFSVQNLWRMKQLYETYKGKEKLSTLSRELLWSQGFPKVILTGTFKRQGKRKDGSVGAWESMGGMGAWEYGGVGVASLTPLLSYSDTTLLR